MSHPLPVPSYKSVQSLSKAVPDICTQGSLDDANVQQSGSTIVLSFNAGAGLLPQLTLLDALASAPGFSSYQIIGRPCFHLAIAHHHYMVKCTKSWLLVPTSELLVQWVWTSWAEHVYTGHLVPLYACSQGWTRLSLRCTSRVLGLELDLNVQSSNLRGSTFLKFRYTPHNWTVPSSLCIFPIQYETYKIVTRLVLSTEWVPGYLRLHRETLFHKNKKNLLNSF